MKKGKILITGAAGFIGTNIFEHLKNKGDDVYGVDFDMIDKKDERMFDINLIEDKRGKFRRFYCEKEFQRKKINEILHI